jgi:hypothetical protein
MKCQQWYSTLVPYHLPKLVLYCFDVDVGLYVYVRVQVCVRIRQGAQECVRVSRVIQPCSLLCHKCDTTVIGLAIIDKCLHLMVYGPILVPGSSVGTVVVGE